MAKRKDPEASEEEEVDLESHDLKRQRQSPLSVMQKKSIDDEDGETSDVNSESAIDLTEVEMAIENPTVPLDHAERTDDFEAGQILSVYMEDFMCHRKHTSTFGRHLTFLNGQNGSGKSAVIAAIQLCLGATARRAGRADAMEGMIRQGATGGALIRVTLLNEGVDAYKPAEYGRRIQIERRISRSGQGQYRLLSHNGEVISKEKRELENILMHFNIYIDNPCCILTQEESKKFIQGQEKDKYAFFLKATGLERNMEEINAVSAMIDEAEEEKKNAKPSIIAKEDLIKKLEHDLQELSKLNEHEDEIQRCMAKVYWIEANRVGDVVVQRQNEIEEAEAQLQKQHEILQTLVAKKDELGSLELATSELDEIAVAIQTSTATIEKIQSEILAQTRAVNSAECTTHQLEKGINTMAGRIRDVEKEIKEQQEAILSKTEGREKEVMTSLQAVTTEIQNLETAIKELHDRNQALFAENSSHEEALRTHQRELQHSQRTIADLEHELANASRGTASSYSRFGKNMDAIMQDVGKAQFRQEIFGPLGAYVSLVDQYKDLGFAVERCLGACLSNFVVTNPQDRVTLWHILKKHRADSTIAIIIQPMKPRYNVRTVDGVTRVCDAVVIQHDVVFNAMVDQCNMDTVLVCDSVEECDARYTTSINGRERLVHDMQRAICRDGTTVRYRNGNKAIEMTRYPYRHLLAADTTLFLANIRDRLAAEQQNAEAIRGTIVDIQNKLRGTEHNAHSINAQMKELNTELGRLKRRQSKIQNDLSELQSMEKVDLSSLDDELAELVKTRDDLNAQLTEHKASCKELSAALAAIQKSKKSEETKKNLLLRRKNEKQQMVEDYINRIENISRDIIKQEAVIKRHERDIEKMQADLQKETEAFAKAEELANQKTREHVKNWDGKALELKRGETREKVDAKIARLRANINESRRKAGLADHTYESLNEKLGKALADRDALMDKYVRVRDLLKNLTADCHHRRELWEKQLIRMGKLVAKNFDMYMQRKGFSGTIKFDHQAKKLIIQSQTDNLDAATQCSDVRQLSGGERSFTTLCLLMALGHVIECPVRIMDEYDVFLDAVARKITLEQLLQYSIAPEQKGRQFIVVTPLNLDGVGTNSKVRIIRMRPPSRTGAHEPVQSTIN